MQWEWHNILLALALGVVGAGTVAAVSIRIIGAMLTRLMTKVDTAPSEKDVQSMVTVATLTLDQKFQSELQLTRHNIKNEMTAQFLPMHVKIEEFGKQLTQVLLAVGSVKSELAHLPRRKHDNLEQQQDG